MRYLALVALLAFLAGCAEKAPTTPKEKPVAKEKAKPETAPAPITPAPTTPAPTPPAEPAPATPK